MSPEHARRRSQVVLVEPALSQLAKLTATETHRLDRAIVAISVNPELGTPVPDTLLRDYVDDIDGVRVIYYVTAFDRRLSRAVNCHRRSACYITARQVRHVRGERP